MVQHGWTWRDTSKVQFALCTAPSHATLSKHGPPHLKAWQPWCSETLEHYLKLQCINFKATKMNNFRLHFFWFCKNLLTLNSWLFYCVIQCFVKQHRKAITPSCNAQHTHTHTHTVVEMHSHWWNPWTNIATMFCTKTFQLKERMQSSSSGITQAT